MVFVLTGTLEKLTREEAKLRIPKLSRRAHPQGDDESLREAAKMLVAAENPVIYANRYGRTEKGPALLIQLAELLHAPVIDGRLQAQPDR